MNTAATRLPLVRNHHPDDVLIYCGSAHRPITVAQFCGQALALAQQMPRTRWVFNLCQDRYNFTLGFAASLLSGQTNLMPPSRAPELIGQLKRNYPQASILIDDEGEDSEHWQSFGLPLMNLREITLDEASADIPDVPADHIAALAFTSGSTGAPKPNAKSWQSLNIATDMAAQRFLGGLQQPTLVATVPPQHMYGLESTVLLAMLGGARVYSGRPFFPQDVVDVLAAMPTPRVLVTTPAHIRAIVRAGVQPPDVAFLISATAPLSADLAAEAEDLFAAPVLEVYGCTEAGAMASRRNLAGPQWQPYEGVRLYKTGDQAMVEGLQLAEPVPLQDLLQISEDGCFELCGRDSDLINIAGKRASLADLNHRLLTIDGVEDGVIFDPDPGSEGRLAALVVSDDLSEKDILDQLRQQTDPVFLPRPLCKVEALPRSETSKLPRDRLLSMLKERSAASLNA